MPQLPFTSISASSGNPRGGGIQAGASAGAFDVSDPNAGRGAMALADAAARVSRAAYAQHAEERAREDDALLANSIALFDPTPGLLQAREASAADGSDLYANSGEYLRNAIDEHANSIDNDRVRAEFRNRMQMRMPDWLSSAAQVAQTQRATFASDQSNAALNSLVNRVRADPTAYRDALQNGMDVIATQPGLSNSDRAAMQIAWRQDISRRMFEGRIERASSVSDLDSIYTDLTTVNESQDWASQMSPADYDRVLSSIDSMRSQVDSTTRVETRALLTDLERRSTDLTLISHDELQQAQQMAIASGDAVLMTRYSSLAHQQDIIRTERGLPPIEIRARAEETMNAGQAYPNMPPVVSGAINEAAEATGISAAYLGGLITREYGGFLNIARQETNPDFAPVAVHPGVNIQRISPEVQDAATLAAEEFGAAFQLSSGYRSAEDQARIREEHIAAGGDPRQVAENSYHTEATAMDISTVGMSDADKARMVEALLNAGFTGFGVYGNHIHADFRDTTPSFDAGRNWGGWTTLPPEVTAVMVAHGYAPGISSDQIQRSERAVTLGGSIDYNQGTLITDPATGQPTSSARGVAQFTNETWLGMMRDGVTATRFGIDVTGMSEEQMLEMRGDPRISIMFAAALAEQRRDQVEETIGRSISEAELYMTHALGAAGAITLFNADPSAIAAEVMPSAASANRPIFYDDDGTPRTVREVYNEYAVGFGADQTAIEYDDAVTRTALADRVETQVQTDPMQLAQTTGRFDIPALSEEGGIAARGQAALAVAEFYSIPLSDMKPFTVSETQFIDAQLKNGTAEDRLSIMTEIQAMGPDMAQAAYAQLEQDNPVFAHAAGLSYSYGLTSVARDIMRGQERIEENPAILTAMDNQASDRQRLFFETMDGAGMGIRPLDQQAIMDAALALYVERTASRSTGGGFDQEAYKAAVNEALGGTADNPAFGTVNGRTVLLPHGFDDGDIETMLDNMVPRDWIDMSRTGLPPTYADGSMVDGDVLRDQTQLQAIGGNEYTVLLPDGRNVMSGGGATGQPAEAFVLMFDPNKAVEIINREQNPNDGSLYWIPSGPDVMSEDAEEAAERGRNAEVTALEEYIESLRPRLDDPQTRDAAQAAIDQTQRQIDRLLDDE